jgi:hypothetical protein
MRQLVYLFKSAEWNTQENRKKTLLSNVFTVSFKHVSKAWIIKQSQQLSLQRLMKTAARKKKQAVLDGRLIRQLLPTARKPALVQ